ncbi:hypothetical protein K438DRAFT_1805212 [Mycena galopus ATCC 62051]|nr:hypothetical protein K438DRAFT_1880394 [Mycena galopus ATCC 62051]KAF8212887.1 hypothetical protein K438DRAFT_1805212 [Mycena galopus ATCC 62051]
MCVHTWCERKVLSDPCSAVRNVCGVYERPLHLARQRPHCKVRVRGGANNTSLNKDTSSRSLCLVPMEAGGSEGTTRSQEN